jgi:hypothetical protein
MLTDRSVIDAVVDAGELIEWKPADHRRAIHRAVLLRPQPFNWLSQTKGDERDALEILRFETIVQIEAFIRGETGLALNFKDIGGRQGICEWKQAKPRPGIRIIGTLLSQDLFAGMMLFTRDQLPFSAAPRQGEGTIWRDIMSACKSEHDRLFPEYSPIRLKAALDLELSDEAAD